MEFGLKALADIINNVGFPIATCIALFWFNRDTISKQQQIITELRDIVRDNSEVMRDLVDEIKRSK